MHTIRTLPETDIIEIGIAGFWTLDDLAALTRDLRSAVGATNTGGRRPSILYDYTDAAIQSQAVVAAIQEMARSDPFGSRRVALYSEGRLARMQARRVAAVSPRFAVFDDRGAAIDWLVTG